MNTHISTRQTPKNGTFHPNFTTKCAPMSPKCSLAPTQCAVKAALAHLKTAPNITKNGPFLPKIHTAKTQYLPLSQRPPMYRDPKPKHHATDRSFAPAFCQTATGDNHRQRPSTATRRPPKPIRQRPFDKSRFAHILIIEPERDMPRPHKCRHINRRPTATLFNAPPACPQPPSTKSSCALMSLRQ